MGKLVTFGEIMGRLNPHGYLRIVQADEYELTFAGGEVNVAVAAANLGARAAFVTKLPKNDLATRALRMLRGYNIDTSHIAFGGERLGMYYVEKGASQRPSKVIYDRAHSAIADSQPSDFDWDAIFEGADWFHFTGITPALGPNLVEACRQACVKAREKGVKVSCDLNYRAKLWSRAQAREAMSELCKYVDVCISNEEDAKDVFGIEAGNSDIRGGVLSGEGYKSVARQLADRFGFEKVAITLRGSLSASDNTWAGMLYDGGACYNSRAYRIHLVDRVGGGDSFAGGLIFALMEGYDPQRAIEVATACSCLKQATEYDFSQSTLDEVLRLADGDASGRVQR